MSVELLIRGGTVIDPEAGTSARADVVVDDGRIVEVTNLPDDAVATRTIDATGRYVTPGLVDLHSHVNWRVHPSSVPADALAPEVGVTTWIDAGSAYPTTIEGLRDMTVDRSTVRILAFLRIGRGGRDLSPPTGLEDADGPLLAAVADRHRDIVVGVKVSMGQCDIRPLEIALDGATRASLPLMAHIAQLPPPVDEVLDRLRPGDIVTHALTGQGMRLIDAEGRVRESARRARDRGVLFDLGHGAGSFSWASAEALVGAGFLPDTISTDSWQVSIRGPMFDLPTCMSKLLHLGLPLVDVIRSVTTRPAAAIGRAGEFGTLRSGSRADLAILRIDSGRFPLYDTSREVRIADRLIRAERTLVAGRELARRAMPPLPDWIDVALGADGFDPNPQGGLRPEVRRFQEELVSRGHVPAVMSPTPS